MVAREALYNSIRHAQPKKVELSVSFEGNKCRVGVRDDGSGFDPAIVSRLPEHHYGLLGIKERVERIGGRFHLQSALGFGTDLSIEVPRSSGAASNPVPEIAI
jgi:signal transduction histidine kinase